MDVASSSSSSFNPRWKIGPQLEVKRQGAAACRVGEYLFVAGGYDGSRHLTSIEAIALRDLVSDGTTKRHWRLLHGLEMKMERSCFGMVLVDKKYLVVLGAAGNKTCEVLDVSWLLSQDEPSEFYRLLLQQQQQDKLEVPLEERLQELTKVVGDVYETKFLYTYVKQYIRQGLIEKDKGHAILRTGLEVSARTCRTEDAIVYYKLMLEKAEADGVIHRDEALRFNNRAEIKRADHALLEGMRAAIEANTRRIEGLERGVEGLRSQISQLYDRLQQLQRNIERVNEHVQHVQEDAQRVHEDLVKLKRDMARRRRIEATTSFMASVLNAVTIGVGGSLLKGFENVLTGIVDFGDPTHIHQVIACRLEKPETRELGEAYATFETHFQIGMQLAMGGDAEDVLSDAIAEENAFVALAAVATLAHEEFSEAQEEIEEINGKEIGNNDAAAREVGATIPEAFRDAFLSMEDEDSFPLHASVKFADIEALNEVLQEEDDVSAIINELDSQGRTALDLAALTGQPKMIELLTSQGGKYKYKSMARMKGIARKRKDIHEEYLAYVEEILS